MRKIVYFILIGGSFAIGAVSMKLFMNKFFK